MSLTADVLGLEQFDEAVFSPVKQIKVPKPNQLIYIFQDGREVETVWQNQSRKFSWTEEAKLEARDKALAYQKWVTI